MLELKQKDIRQYKHIRELGSFEEIQEMNFTVVGKSYGIYGCNGILIMVNGVFYGCPERTEYIYL